MTSCHRNCSVVLCYVNTLSYPTYIELPWFLRIDVILTTEYDDHLCMQSEYALFFFFMTEVHLLPNKIFFFLIVTSFSSFKNFLTLYSGYTKRTAPRLYSFLSIFHTTATYPPYPPPPFSFAGCASSLRYTVAALQLQKEKESSKHNWRKTNELLKISLSPLRCFSEFHNFINNILSFIMVFHRHCPLLLTFFQKRGM